MIFDRPYMHDDPGRSSLSPLTWLVCILAGAFVIENVAVLCLSAAAESRVFDTLTLSANGLSKGFVWSLMTHGLIHDPKNLLPLLIILLATYLFGRAIMAELGGRTLLWVFASAVAVGGLAWLSVNGMRGGQFYGASAGVSALIVLFACLSPHQPITLFMLDVGLRAKHLALGLLVIDLLGLVLLEIPGRSSWFALSHSAHLGGMLAGWLYFQFVCRRSASPLFNRKPSVELPRWFRKARQTESAPAAYKVNINPPNDLRTEIDRILDKINSEGFQALTEDEKSRLDQARNHLSRR